MSPHHTNIQRKDPTEIIPDQERYYYAEISAQTLSEQSEQIDRVIALAFDVLGAHHLEVRVEQAIARGCA